MGETNPEVVGPAMADGASLHAPDSEFFLVSSRVCPLFLLPWLRPTHFGYRAPHLSRPPRQSRVQSQAAAAHSQTPLPECGEGELGEGGRTKVE